MLKHRRVIATILSIVALVVTACSSTSDRPTPKPAAATSSKTPQEQADACKVVLVGPEPALVQGGLMGLAVRATIWCPETPLASNLRVAIEGKSEGPDEWVVLGSDDVVMLTGLGSAKRSDLEDLLRNNTRTATARCANIVGRSGGADSDRENEVRVVTSGYVVFGEPPRTYWRMFDKDVKTIASTGCGQYSARD